ncbi:hypothetical protein O1611_g10573 [Lasiodiplodia mahajangana]|uniref:Uncharacterized protein n=1 Tax=Lasiodiplodia mahajangana TaxID=1108764 RepID=A0ACC2IWK2_9PEZI|nr:hypothetical protein O1611_g10573 [Lasiodiplodia mahajangana]
MVTNTHHVTGKREDESHNTIPFARSSAGGISFKQLHSNSVVQYTEKPNMSAPRAYLAPAHEIFAKTANSRPVITTS